MHAVRKAVPSAVPSAVVPLRQTQEGIAPYRESHETADYLGANPVVLTHNEDVSESGNRLWGSTSGTESTYALDYAPSIPAASSLPQRVMPVDFGGSVSASDRLMPAVTSQQAPHADAHDLWEQHSQRLDNNGTQSTNNTGQMTSYASPDGETYAQVNLGDQSRMQGFTMTAPGALGFDMQQQVVTPQPASSLPRNSGAPNDSVFGAIWQGTGSTVVSVSDVPATSQAAPAPTYAPLGWG